MLEKAKETRQSAEEMTDLKLFDAETVCRELTYPRLIPEIRRAMTALSTGKVDQNLRSFVPVKAKHIFALMPAADHDIGCFGAKLVSVFADAAGQTHHSGYVMLFSEESGQPLALADAEEISRIRTAAASAVATDALARHDAGTLAILGTGKQAEAHAEAIAEVRPLRCIRIWGRHPEKAAALAQKLSERTGIRTEACADAGEAVHNAEIICTTTGASQPILKGAWLAPGAHVNIVGSSTPGPVEVDSDLVVKSRFIVDHRPHVLAHGAEFLKARADGRIDDSHIAAEIGEVLAGLKEGRQTPDQITAYKSLGHAVQDIAATALLWRGVQG